jgi:hypothetical protein
MLQALLPHWRPPSGLTSCRKSLFPFQKEKVPFDRNQRHRVVHQGKREMWIDTQLIATFPRSWILHLKEMGKRSKSVEEKRKATDNKSQTNTATGEGE